MRYNRVRDQRFYNLHGEKECSEGPSQDNGLGGRSTLRPVRSCY